MFLVSWEIDTISGWIRVDVTHWVQGDNTDFTDNNIYSAYETYRNPAGRPLRASSFG